MKRDMTLPQIQQPLTEIELDRLGDFLAAIGPPALNIEGLDGYFCALISGPELVMPSEYLPQVLSESFSFESDAQANDIVGLLFQHWNTVAAGLWRTLDTLDVYMPALLDNDEGGAHGNDWAKGFLRGVAARSRSWCELFDNEERGGALLPILMLAHENDPDPSLRTPPIPPEKRSKVLQTMAAGLTVIYRYFAPHRRSRAQAAERGIVRHAGRKPGRNDPCPCGSAKKYKRCCAPGATRQAALH
jgi:uncharacterized protein